MNEKETGYGICEYCGQTNLIRAEGETQAEANERASAVCDCAQAKAAVRERCEKEIAERERAEKLARAESEIETLTLGTEETLGVGSFGEDICAALLPFTEFVIDKKLSEVTIMRGTSKLKVKRNIKGDLKIERSDSTRFSAEV